MSAGQWRWQSEYPQMGTGPIPVEPYVSKEYFELEKERLFKRVWLNVGRVEEIPEAGNYVVKEIAVWNTSIIVVRGADGKIRAFHNICPHRGTKVVTDTKGSCRRFTCGFHGWTFDLQGELKGVPDENQFYDFDKSKHNMAALSLDTWEGFVFVHLDRQPKETLAQQLADFGERLSGFPFHKMSVCYSWQAELKCNWKVGMDAFQEGYHVAFVHGRTVPRSSANEENPLAHPMKFILSSAGHRMMSLYGNPNPPITPVDQVFLRHGGHSIRSRVVPLDQLPKGVNPTMSPTWGFDLNVLFPNFYLLLYGIGFYTTYNWWPLAADRSIFEVRMYFPPPENPVQRVSQEYVRSSFHFVFREDLKALEQIGAILPSGALSHFVLQDNEILLRHAYRMVEDRVGFYKQRAASAAAEEA